MSVSLPYRLLHSAIAGIERDVDRITSLLRGAYDGKIRVLAYAGYRSASRLHVRGRAVRYAPSVRSGASTLAKLRLMLDIYNSQEVAGVAVRLSGYGRASEQVTDGEGYFTFDLAIDEPLPEATAWEHVTISTPDHEAQQASFEVPVLAPGSNGNWGIISDIDDTVVETGATDFVKNWRRVLVDQPADRLAVPGASSLYKMIAVDHISPARPFFYVSSSPWNLYGFITEFMELNGIPHGPMFLKDYGIDEQQLFTRGHDAHKLAAIRQVLSTYPTLRFLLIGDNGQRDVSIYAEIAREFVDRVAGVFIRDVDGSCRSGPEGALLAGIERRGIPTFCGAGFDDAAAVVEQLDLERPIEAAKAVIDRQPKAPSH